MKAAGFPWRPRVGDWYVSYTGHCDLVRTHDQALLLGGNGSVFLPTWEDCRSWLDRHGWRDPEVDDDHDGTIRLHVTHKSGVVKRAVGHSDLDCLYRIILQVLVGKKID
jgi:hypothetical protein